MTDGITQVGSEFHVSTQTIGEQKAPDIAYLADGGYVIVWQSYDQDTEGEYAIYGQRYDADGNTVGSEFLYNSESYLGSTRPVVTGLSNGGFIIVAQSVSTADIVAQIYDANGDILVSDFLVNTSTSSIQYDPSVTELAGGGFVITWTSRHDSTNGNEVYGQQYDAAGDTVGLELLINTSQSGDQGTSNVAALTGGGFIVSWTDTSAADGDRYGVYAQIYTELSVKSGSEFLVNTYTTERQGDSSAAGLKDGGFIIAWQSFGQEPTGSGNGIFAQRYDAAGATVGSEFQVNTRTSLYQLDANVAALEDGGFVIVYASEYGDGDNYGIAAQRYDANGDTVGGEVTINTYTTHYQGDPAVTTLANGGFTVTWQSYDQDGDQFGVYAQQFAAELWGTSDADTIVDTFRADWIDGQDGNDHLKGKLGDDVMFGGNGQDKLVGGRGNDTLNGGAKSDILRGDAGNDILLGKAGNDKLTGGEGNDRMTGGSGADVFVYKTALDSGTGNKTDVITDFTRGEDHIDLHLIDPTFIGSAAFSGTVEVRITSDGVDSKVKIDVDGDGIIDMKIIVEGVVGLTEGDFIL